MRKLLLLASLIPSFAFAASLSVVIDGEATIMTDIPANAWYAPHVRTLAESGIMQGYRDSMGKLTGKFGSANAVTRAEFLKMIAVMMVYRYDFDRNVAHTGDRWYAPYVLVVEAKDPELSLVMPIDDASLKQPILRHEAAGLIHLGLGGYIIPRTWDLYPLFSDMTQDTPNAFAIAELKYYGVVNGDGDTGKFNPYRSLNRAEAAKMLVTTAASYQTPLGIPKTGDPTYDSQEGCETEGGTWKRWGNAAWDTCNFPTSDGGKQCTEFFHCEGECVSDDPNATSGTCSEWKQMYGCYYYIRQGEVQPQICQ